MLESALRLSPMSFHEHEEGRQGDACGVAGYLLANANGQRDERRGALALAKEGTRTGSKMGNKKESIENCARRSRATT